MYKNIYYNYIINSLEMLKKQGGGGDKIKVIYKV